jgi:hypothetical protein
MTRSSKLCGLLGILSVASIALLPAGCESGGIGDPCIPEDEYDPQFPGYKMTLENIESRSFQCQTRICLVNHFQGRVSCPLGQNERTSCRNAQDQPDDTKCRFDVGGTTVDLGKCVETTPIAPDCNPKEEVTGCPSNTVCNPNGFCECVPGLEPSEAYFCDSETKQFRSFICHKPNNCQHELLEGTDPKDNCDNNQPKACCIPGTDIPVGVPVCGQCGDSSSRGAQKSVYCSCRCDVAEGQEKDPDFNFCECPTGFSCTEIRPDVGLGDAQIAGKYCIQEGTEYNEVQDPFECKVDGVLPIGQGCDGQLAVAPACL